MVNFKNPLTVFTTLNTLHKLGECGSGWGGEGGGAESGITSLICD